VKILKWNLQTADQHMVNFNLPYSGQAGNRLPVLV
jgi:hypothetical protein